MYISFKFFNQSVGGLFSPEFQEAPWNWDRVVDLLAHLWVPVIIIGTAGTASLIRIMRANLLDELRKPYVVTARAKGLSEWRLLFKYPVRIALNPFISTVGWVLPTLVSGAAIVSIVLSLPTTGPLLIRALLQQDMYLAASFIMMLSILTIIGTLVSDLLLAWLDPRIRYE
jgi:peptide/nickel transport system permease protein